MSVEPVERTTPYQFIKQSPILTTSVILMIALTIIGILAACDVGMLKGIGGVSENAMIIVGSGMSIVLLVWGYNAYKERVLQEAMAEAAKCIAASAKWRLERVALIRGIIKAPPTLAKSPPPLPKSKIAELPAVATHLNDGNMPIDLHTTTTSPYKNK